jgi:hypothetical protein
LIKTKRKHAEVTPTIYSRDLIPPGRAPATASKTGSEGRSGTTTVTTARRPPRRRARRTRAAVARGGDHSRLNRTRGRTKAGEAWGHPKVRPRPESAEVCAGTISLDGPDRGTGACREKRRPAFRSSGGRMNRQSEVFDTFRDHQGRLGHGPGWRGGGLRSAPLAVSQANQPSPSAFRGVARLI